MYRSEYSRRDDRKSSRRRPPPRRSSSALPDAAQQSENRRGWPQMDRTHERWEERPSRRPRNPGLDIAQDELHAGTQEDRVLTAITQELV